MYFKACGRSLLWNWLLKLILTENLFRIASKLTSIVTILASREYCFCRWPHFSGIVSITKILRSIVTILESFEQVNTPQERLRFISAKLPKIEVNANLIFLYLLLCEAWLKQEKFDAAEAGKFHLSMMRGVRKSRRRIAAFLAALLMQNANRIYS